MSSKKAQSLSVNVIIVAILALLVLVVLGFVFAGKIGDFVKGTKDCLSIGGVCNEGTQCNANEGFKETTLGMCLDQTTGKRMQDRVCCIKIDPTIE